jgi:hypothetical protein
LVHKLDGISRIERQWWDMSPVVAPVGS